MDPVQARGQFLKRLYQLALYTTLPKRATKPALPLSIRVSQVSLYSLGSLLSSAGYLIQLQGGASLITLCIFM